MSGRRGERNRVNFQPTWLDHTEITNQSTGLLPQPGPPTICRPGTRLR